MEFFHLDILKTEWNGIKNGMENGKFDSKMDTIRAFSQNNQCFFFFFNFQKWAVEDSPSILVVCL